MSSGRARSCSTRAARAVFLSSDVLPAYREYERTSTTVAAARIAGASRTTWPARRAPRGARRRRPAARYDQLRRRRRRATPSPSCRSRRCCRGRPVASRRRAGSPRRPGSTNLLTLDMGGTSCDVSGIVGGVPDERLDMSVAATPSATRPTTSRRSARAAAASPGSTRAARCASDRAPRAACPAPLATAAAAPSRRSPTRTSSSAATTPRRPRRLGPARSRGARSGRSGRCAEPLGLSIAEAAAGILRIVNILMINAVRVISVERGRDVRDFTLVAYGGAGPTHAVEIARELSIPQRAGPAVPRLRLGVRRGHRRAAAATSSGTVARPQRPDRRRGAGTR